MDHLLSPQTRLGYVQYTVADLPKQLAFYTTILGLQVHWQKDGAAGLGAGKADLVRLEERKGAQRFENATGLYHQAFLLPSRRELARAVKRLMVMGVPQSPTDHIISHTTYLRDPEGNTIELLADTPEEGTWETTPTTLTVRDKHGRTRRPSEPLDVDTLLAHLQPDDDLQQPFPPETTTGHVHLYMNDLETAMHFYHRVLGFGWQSLLHNIGMADTNLPGFNVHIVAFNVWKGHNAPPAPAGAAGMQFFTVNLTSEKDREGVLERARQEGLPTENHPDGILIKDPVGNGVLLQVVEKGSGKPPAEI